MYIDKLEQQKNDKIEEHEKRFPNDEATAEMFVKKYEGSYYKGYGQYKLVTYPQPFINILKLAKEKDTLNFTYIDVTKFPRLNDKIYKIIENYPDYDYLNSIAYEMFIRTKEYKQLRDPDNKDSYEDKRKKLDLLGIDIDDIYSLKYISERENHLYLKMTISDIENGLEKLINFYINKKQIYIIDSAEKTMLNNKEMITNRTFKVVSDVKIENVKASLSNYYIPTKFDYNKSMNNENFINIDENMPLVALHEDFLLTIEELIPNRIKGSIDFNFTRPLLRFKELPIVDVPINLNSSKEELTQFVLKLKDDLKKGSIKNPINILYNRKYKVEKIQNITPFKMTKKAIAEAFFIYDLYQVVNNAMSLHKKRLNNYREQDIKKIENDIKLEKKEKEKEINKIITNCKSIYKDNKTLREQNIEVNERDLRVFKRKLEKKEKEKKAETNKSYKGYFKDYHTMTVLEDLVYKKAISHYTCKQYLKFMRKNIQKLGYKELVIGKPDIY